MNVAFSWSIGSIIVWLYLEKASIKLNTLCPTDASTVYRWMGVGNYLWGRSYSGWWNLHTSSIFRWFSLPYLHWKVNKGIGLFGWILLWGACRSFLSLLESASGESLFLLPNWHGSWIYIQIMTNNCGRNTWHICRRPYKNIRIFPQELFHLYSLYGA